MNLPFIQSRQARWKRLEELLGKISNQKISALSKMELIEFSVLYRRLLSDLAMAKAKKLPVDLVGFLNELAGRAYHQLYRAEQHQWDHIRQFFRELPFLIRQHQKIILFSIGLMFTGWLFGFLGELTAPETVHRLIPAGIPQKVLSGYEDNSWFNDPLTERPYISALIMLNNINVSLIAFAGGMLLGTYTLYIVVFNGFFLGVISGVFYKGGHALSFWAMILPHGVIELTAIGLAAAAGFLLTSTILFPGELSRSDALRQYGQNGAKLFVGAVCMLVVAGLIEGFLSTINREVIAESIRLLFAVCTAIALLWYFNWGKEKSKAA